MADLLVHNELLLLFLVMAVGLVLGRVQYQGVRLGSAGVLFAGLALGAWLRPVLGARSVLTEIKELGLVIFVYCVGLTSGPGLFSAWRKGGLRLNLAIVAGLASGALVAVIGGHWLGLERGHIAGIFCGALTNTPALGAASERLAGTPFASQPVLGYSISYPFGVLGALISFRIFGALQRPRLREEISARRAEQAPISSANLLVTQTPAIGQSLGALQVRQTVGVIVSRLRRGSEVLVPTKYTVLQKADVVTVVGPQPALATALRFFGELSAEHLEQQRDRVDMRRILMSRRELVGRQLEELKLERRFNAQVTRLRRADIDLVPSGELRLELGDRLRVVAPVDQLPAIGAYFGDSERELAELDFVALALGLSAGLLLAQLPLPVLGARLQLGAAGGPLLLSLLLGWLGRTGPLVWSLPYEANHGLRELGLLLFLAGVGSSAGGHLAETFNDRGLVLLGLGALVTLAASAVALSLAHFWAKAGVIASLGATSGMQTQPATLAAAFDLSGHSEATYVAYALVYPVAMIGKILVAQLIVLLA